MKTLVNKANPAIRVTAPDGMVKNRTNCWAIWSEGNRLMLLDKDNWTLVEEEPEKQTSEYFKKPDYDKKVVKKMSKELAKIITDQIVEPKVDFKVEERKWVHDAVDSVFPEDGDFMSEVDFRKILKDTARHFYELGLKARKEE